MSAASTLNAGSVASVDAPEPTAAEAYVNNRHMLTAGTLILLVPNILFAVQLRPIPAAVVLVGALGLIALQYERATAAFGMLSQPLALPRLGICLVAALLLLMLGGEGHLVFANPDWLWRDSVLADLARSPFPPSYRVGDQTFFLRAPLGMYMLPALIAKATSLGWGHAALLLQNAALLALVLYMLASIAGRHALLVVLVFLTFSGLDVIGEILIWLLSGQNILTFVLPSHIDNWTRFQFSSVITQLFWVPNHALPSYWLTILVLLCAKREISIGQLGINLAASVFWSPFAVIGTLPLASYLLIRDGRAAVAGVRFWFAAAVALCFLPVAFYMTLDAVQVPHEFLLVHLSMAFGIMLFLLIEIPHAAVVGKAWHDLEPSIKGVLVVSIGFLIVLPTVRMGAANDIVMRASIPALMILALAFAKSLGVAWEHGHFRLVGAGLVLTIVGAVTPAQEIIRSWTFSAFEISDCNIVTVWKKLPKGSAIENYLARDSHFPSRLMEKPGGTELTNQDHKICWPNAPFSPLSNLATLSNSVLLRQDEKQKPPL